MGMLDQGFVPERVSVTLQGSCDFGEDFDQLVRLLPEKLLNQHVNEKVSKLSVSEIYTLHNVCIVMDVLRLLYTM